MTTSERKTLLLERVLIALVAVATLVFVGFAIGPKLLEKLPQRWVADGDHMQSIFQYWRYAVDGAFRPGDLLVDYAFVMHAPPVWWAAMSAGSAVFGDPIVAAKALHVIALAATLTGVFLVVRARTHTIVAFAAVAVLLRAAFVMGQMAGGYARSFGGALVFFFLFAWLSGRHAFVLAMLVFQAAFYPSVVIPCGIAYGVYCLAAGPMPARIRRCATLTVAGLAIIALGKFQDLRAPTEWGPLVTVAEALEMPAWKAGGRISEAPLKPVKMEMLRYVERLFEPAPGMSGSLGGIDRSWFVLGWFALLGLVVLADRIWRMAPRTGEKPFPWQLFLLAGAAVPAYFLARFLAFKLYLPYRTLQHTWPFLLCLIAAAISFSFVEIFVRRRLLAAVLATLVLIVPTFSLLGVDLSDRWAAYNIDERGRASLFVGSSRVDLQACKLEYSIVSPK